MSRPTVDLNADLGELTVAGGRHDDLAHDAALLEIVTSANVACGFHAGGPARMAATVRACATRGVGIGAHPSFPDIEGFGRRRMPHLVGDELVALIRYQIGALAAITAAEGAAVGHVKLHGALDNMASEDPGLAATCVEAIGGTDPALAVIATSGTAMASAVREAGLPLVSQVFADRAYRGDGTLVPRSEPGAVLDDPGRIADRVLRMVHEGVVETADGALIEVEAATVCVHGDTPGAVAIARRLRDVLEADGLVVGRATAGP